MPDGREGGFGRLDRRARGIAHRIRNARRNSRRRLLDRVGDDLHELARSHERKRLAVRRAPD